MSQILLMSRPMEEFYKGFFKSDNQDDHKILHPNGGDIAFTHTGTMSAITGIILSNRNQISKATQEYITKVGPNCTTTCDRGISGTHIYCNVYATCC